LAQDWESSWRDLDRDGLTPNTLTDARAVSDDTKVYMCRSLQQIRRRRLVALSLLASACIVAIVMPVTVYGNRTQGSATLDGSVVSDTISNDDPGSGASGESNGSGLYGNPYQDSDSPAPAVVLSEERLAAAIENATKLKANELGRIPILMYHKIGNDVVSPARLRDDIARLKAAGFYPTTVREMAEGTMNIPAGKSPVILTFDDSSPTHYKILADGSLDPNCAVAILLAAADAGDWARKASFFPLLYLETPQNILFGQPEYAQKKLQNLVAWGFEIGSHTVDHLDLSRSTPGHIREELAESQSRLEELIGGGYHVYTLNPPYGEFPDDLSLLSSGEYEGVTYEYKAALKAGGGYCYSPFSTIFDPMSIPRVSAYKRQTVPDLLWYFREYPELRFISDGDPEVISVPANLAAKLGTPRTDLTQPVVYY
jgi:hypothetical protein